VSNERLLADGRIERQLKNASRVDGDVEIYRLSPAGLRRRTSEICPTRDSDIPNRFRGQNEPSSPTLRSTNRHPEVGTDPSTSL